MMTPASQTFPTFSNAVRSFTGGSCYHNHIFCTCMIFPKPTCGAQRDPGLPLSSSAVWWCPLDFLILSFCLWHPWDPEKTLKPVLCFPITVVFTRHMNSLTMVQSTRGNDKNLGILQEKAPKHFMVSQLCQLTNVQKWWIRPPKNHNTDQLKNIFFS